MTEATEYLKMLQKADFQERGNMIFSPSAQDMINMFMKKGWSMLDVVETMYSYYIENFSFEDISLKPLLLYIVELHLYNKHWDGENWVTLSTKG